jgi:uncharacterized protein (TIGR03067 family)
MSAVLLVAATLLIERLKPSNLPPARDDLQGQWSVLVWDSEGCWLSAGPGALAEGYRNIVVSFTKDRVLVKPKDRKGWSFLGRQWDWLCAYKTDSTKSPAEIDVIAMAHDLSGGKEEGVVLDDVRRGIYHLQGNRLTICLDRSEKSERPKRFSIDPKRSHIILLLERTEKGDKAR